MVMLMITTKENRGCSFRLHKKPKERDEVIDDGQSKEGGEVKMKLDPQLYNGDDGDCQEKR